MKARYKLPKGTITFIGSGEMSPSMSRVHRSVAAAIPAPVNAVFIDTPAGFQLNVNQISQKAVRYFKKHFDIPLSVASFKAADTPTADENKTLAKIKSADYVFAGPGSPTYAVKNWRGTRVLNAMMARFADGAHLVFASAASIAAGSYALPVYEIYKVGQPPHWVNGLNLLAPLNLEPVIIPHWNNREGGTHDTRFCYMGAPRFQTLAALLPEAAGILGIDEHTAVTIDFYNEKCRVSGAGTATLQQSGRELRFSAGEHFDLDLLRHLEPGAVSRPAALAQETVFGGDVDWPDDADPEHDSQIPEKLIDSLVKIRSRLRNEQRWGMADEIRDALSAVGIVIEDGINASTWKKIG